MTQIKDIKVDERTIFSGEPSEHRCKMILPMLFFLIFFVAHVETLSTLGAEWKVRSSHDKSNNFLTLVSVVILTHDTLSHLHAFPYKQWFFRPWLRRCLA